MLARQGRGVPGTQNKARAARSPPGLRLPAWSSPRLSSSSSSSGGGDGGQSPGRRRCSAPAAAGAAAQEGAALTPMPVHAGLVRSGEGGGAGAVAGPGLWLRHGPGDAPRFLLFFLSGQRPRAATAAARNGASRAKGGGHGARTHRGGRTRQAERGGRKDTKIVSERRKQPRARGRPGPQLAWARRAWICRTSPAVAASGPESSAPVACAVNQSRSLTLSPPHRVSTNPRRSRPRPHSSSPSHWLQACLPPPHRPCASHSSSASAACGWGSFVRAQPPAGFLVLFLLHPFFP